MGKNYFGTMTDGKWKANLKVLRKSGNSKPPGLETAWSVNSVCLGLVFFFKGLSIISLINTCFWVQ